MTSYDKSLVVVTHARDDFDANEYFVKLLIPHWERRGIAVRVLHGIAERPHADVALAHVNLTVVPVEYRRFLATYPLVVNGRVNDIAKRRVCTHLVRRPGEWDGPVIVKTDLNYGGRPERWQTRATSRLGRLTMRIEQRLPWSWSGDLGVSDYKIYERASEVPRIVWRNRRLAVQRFLPERHGSSYCLRQWVFFGDREMSSISYAEAPIVKASNTVKRERDVPIPDEIRRLRSQLGFDYGKFDFGVVDGEVILYDANRTPTRSRDRAIAPDLARYVADLAHGIDGFLATPGASCAS